MVWSSIAGKIIIPTKVKNEHFRHGQIVTACLVSLAHGAGDAQKTMGVIFLALVAAVIILAIVWIARDSITHYFGMELFGGL